MNKSRFYAKIVLFLSQFVLKIDSCRSQFGLLWRLEVAGGVLALRADARQGRRSTLRSEVLFIPIFGRYDTIVSTFGKYILPTQSVIGFCVRETLSDVQIQVSADPTF